MARPVTPAESVDPATRLTGSETLALAEGEQMVTEGSVEFRVQGAAEAVA